MHKVLGKVDVGHGHIALAGVDLHGGVAALAVLGQIIQAQGFQRGALLPVDLLALAAVAVVADAAPGVLSILQVLGFVAGIGVDVGVQHNNVGEGEHLLVGGFVDGIAPLAVRVVLLHLIGVGRSIVDKAGLVRLAVYDLDVLAIADNGAVLVAVGAVDAVGQITGLAQAVINKVEEGGVVGLVHVHLVVVDVALDVVRVGVHRVLQRQGAVVVALAGPVHTAVVAVTVGTVVVVQVAVAVVDGVLLHNDGLTLVDIQRLPGQDEAEELVTAGTHGADLANGLVVGEHGHKAGDAALDLDLEQDVRLGQAALRAGGHDVVDHHSGDALALGVVSTLGLTGQHVGLVGRQGRLRGGFGLGRRAGCRGGGDGVIRFFAGGQQHAERQQRRKNQELAFHSQFPFSVL